jgi:hypothetical protein
LRRSQAAAAGFRAVRYTVRADLAGRRFEQFPVDVALSESPSSKEESLLMSGSLEFAEVSSWVRPYAELAREVGIATDIDAGHAAAADLLDPVLGSDAEGRWDPKARHWR